MSVNVVDHPLIKHKLALMREDDVTTKDFRDLAAELAMLLTYEATKNLETETKTIQGWAGPVQVEKIKGKKITVVPILRAGLGMMTGVLNLIPSAKVSVVGLYRNEETLEPVRYYVKMTSSMEKRIALITFNQPYRANAYYQYLQKKAPSLTLDWYRIGMGRYQVVMLYADNKSLENGRKKLRKLGVIVKAR